MHPKTKLEDLVVYVTSQTHSLGVKASLVLGLECRILEVRAEDGFALRGETLKAALVEDETKGRQPFILSECSLVALYSILYTFPVATVGTTSSGAIDRLDEVGEVCTWDHISAQLSKPDGV